MVARWRRRWRTAAAQDAAALIMPSQRMSDDEIQQDFTGRLHDAIVTTLVREAKLVDYAGIKQCRAAIEALTPVLGVLVGEATRDQPAIDEVVDRIKQKIHRIASEVLADRKSTPASTTATGDATEH